MPMTMPKVLDCEVTDCAYNRNKECHTMAITVGAHECPFCDTFYKSAQKGGAPDMMGGVGACRESDCRFNKSLECTASGIHIGLHEGHADCKTFSPK